MLFRSGWKIAGSMDLDGSLADDIVYLGTVENGGTFVGFPWKISGAVYTYDNLNNTPIYTALANGATAFDTNSSTFIPLDQIQFIPDNYAPGAFDLYIAYNANTLGAEVECIVSFEFEFSQLLKNLMFYCCLGIL